MFFWWLWLGHIKKKKERNGEVQSTAMISHFSTQFTVFFLSLRRLVEDILSLSIVHMHYSIFPGDPVTVTLFSLFLAQVFCWSTEVEVRHTGRIHNKNRQHVSFDNNVPPTLIWMNERAALPNWKLLVWWQAGKKKRREEEAKLCEIFLGAKNRLVALSSSLTDCSWFVCDDDCCVVKAEALRVHTWTCSLALGQLTFLSEGGTNRLNLTQ